MEKEEIRKAVREGYAKVAGEGSCCVPPTSCCSGTSLAADLSKRLGYTDEDLSSTPEGANMGLGCGNPIALASLTKGETVLDLGSGGGFDCFLAAQKVGPSGKVIGVDMTPEMVEKARRNAKANGYSNVEFRLGEIENIPVADSSVDIVISNCVINLSTDKKRAFEEAYRALRPGGRVLISDLVLLRNLPDFVRASKEAYVACIAGAALKGEYLKMIEDAGFVDVNVTEETQFPLDCIVSDPTAGNVIEELDATEEELEKLAKSVVSLKVSARKPS